jgi:deoxycytidylate deaminase
MAKTLESSHDFRRYKISDEIRSELESKGALAEKPRENWRKAMQDHGNLRRQEKPEYWSEKIADKIFQDVSDEKPIVIDGIRNHHEVRFLRHTFPNFFLIAVCAEKENRWPRVKDDYDGRQAEFERDDRRDQNENVEHGQTVQRCVDDADFIYCNDTQHIVRVAGTEKPDTIAIETEFKKQASDFVLLLKGDLHGRTPTTEELQIAAAYALSNASGCLKRHVGAVITVNDRGLEVPISVGYNDSPAGVTRCMQSGRCRKDDYLSSWFGAQGKVHCPHCGKEHHSPTHTTLCECGHSLRDWLQPLRGMQFCRAVHAEERAIRSLGQRNVKDGILYVTSFPCFQCARMILDTGIREVVYVEAYPQPEARDFLKENGCKVRPFNGFTARSFFRVFPRVS